jgi:hypothetical protein
MSLLASPSAAIHDSAAARAKESADAVILGHIVAHCHCSAQSAAHIPQVAGREWAKKRRERFRRASVA